MDKPLVTTKITGVKDVLAKQTKDERYYLKFKFHVAEGKTATLVVFIEDYSDKEMQDLLQALKFVGSQEDFLADNEEQRVKNFKVDFSTNLECKVSEEVFTNDKKESFDWLKVVSVGDNFVAKEKVMNAIQNKERFLKRFPTISKEVPF